jgi:hypothetical protein
MMESSLLLICTVSFGQDTNLAMIKAISSSLDQYKCSDCVRAVNNLRSLGKEQALKILETDLRENPHDNLKVILICRLLFQNPAGWKPPVMGVPSPPVGSNSVAKFPLFPTALSERVPFVLLKDYELDGRGEFASDYIKRCNNLPMITNDLASENYKAAARALIKSEEFKTLYIDHNELVPMSLFISKQAE